MGCIFWGGLSLRISFVEALFWLPRIVVSGSSLSIIFCVYETVIITMMSSLFFCFYYKLLSLVLYDVLLLTLEGMVGCSVIHFICGMYSSGDCACIC